MSASLSTHVLDTAAGRPAAGVTVELLAETEQIARLETDGDGRAQLAEALEPGRYRLVFHPPSPFFRRMVISKSRSDPSACRRPIVGPRKLGSGMTPMPTNVRPSTAPRR